MPVTPPLARHTIEDSGDRLTISIPSRKQWVQTLFLGFWLVGWAFGEITVLGTLFSGIGFGGPNLFMMAWLGMWTIGGGWAIYTLLWQISGKEIIEVTAQSITTKRAVVGLTVLPKEYLADHIKDLRVSSAISGNDIFGWSRTSNFWGMSDGIIAFDYGAQTFKFGGGIDEAEAKQVVSIIQQRFSQYRNRQVST